LSDAELLAILLRSGSGGATAVDLAKAMLSRYGSLGSIAGRSVSDMMQFRGLGSVKAVTLASAFELGRRSAVFGSRERFQIRTPEDVVRHVQPMIRDLHQEVFVVLLLDSANHLLRQVQVSKGTLNSSLVHPREVFHHAIVEPAAGVILIHNHPSGNPEPSQEDLRITKQLVESGKIIGIPVHDHLVITPGSYTSFAERGLI
jgi:DNA repair protein RadC